MWGRLTVAVDCPVGSIVSHSQGRDIYDSAPLAWTLESQAKWPVVLNARAQVGHTCFFLATE
jgi:hypothetical protein